MVLMGTMILAMLGLTFESAAETFAPIIMLLGLVGLFRPGVTVRPYRLWNRLAHFYGKAAELVVLRICYWTVIVPGGWAGTILKLTRPGATESLWTPRQSLPPSLYLRLHSSRGNEGRENNWVARYLAWARQSKQPWLLALLPFLAILLWLKGEEEAVVRESIYTLF
jgi:hypothetical protein